MDMLLSIGFYVDGEEVEPKAPVNVTLRMLNGDYENGEEISVIHFGTDGTEKLNASAVETDEDGNQITSFETNSFSSFGVGSVGITTYAIGSLEEGEYVIYSNGYVLTHKGGSLEAVETAIVDSTITVPEGYTKENLVWNYSVSNGAGYLKGGDYYLYGSSSGYGNDRKYFWGLSDSNQTALTINESGSISGRISNSLRYLNLNQSNQSNERISADNSSQTNWTFVAQVDSTPYKVEYNLNLKAEDSDVTEKVSGEFSDEELENGIAIDDSGEVGVAFPYTTKLLNYKVTKDENGKYHYYTFNGWKTATGKTVNGTITNAQASSYANSELDENGKKVIELIADWQEKTNGTGVKFYINLSGEVATADTDTSKQELGKYSGSVYETTTNAIYGTNGLPSVYYKKEIIGGSTVSRVLVAEKAEEAKGIDASIRSLATTGVEVTGVDNGGTYTYKLASFPTEEQVFAELRTYQSNAKSDDEKIKYDNQVVPVDDLNADNYTIRWFTFHHNSSDQWHVDGMLVRKQENWL